MSDLGFDDFLAFYAAMAIAKLLIELPRMAWFLRVVFGGAKPKYEDMTPRKAEKVKRAIKDGAKLMREMEMGGVGGGLASAVMAIVGAYYVLSRSIAWPYFLGRQIIKHASGPSK